MICIEHLKRARTIAANVRRADYDASKHDTSIEARSQAIEAAFLAADPSSEIREESRTGPWRATALGLHGPATEISARNAVLCWCDRVERTCEARGISPREVVL